MARFSFLASLLAFAFTSNSIATELGTKLTIKHDSQNTPQFGVTYTLGDDTDGMSYLITYSTILSNLDLNNLPSKIRWNVYLANSNSYLYDWSEAKTLTKSSLLLNQRRLTDSNALKLLLVNQSNSFLVFAFDQKNTPAFHIAIGEMCLAYPQLFKDLTGHNKKCSELTDADVNP